MAEVARQFKRLDQGIFLMQFTKDAPGLVEATVVYKVDEALRCDVPVFSQSSEDCRQSLCRKPQDDGFIEARDDQCQSRESSRVTSCTQAGALACYSCCDIGW